MKRLKINTPYFIELEHQFSRWLNVLGYSKAVVNSCPLQVREFFHYLESHEVYQLKEASTVIIQSYYAHLSKRINTTREGALSSGSLNNHINALKRLAEYLLRKKEEILPIEVLSLEKPSYQSITPLTPEDIQSLYTATESYEKSWLTKALRDRAILALLYDCGLRRSESIQLATTDIDKDSRTLLVRQGKNNKDRIVPFSNSTAVHLLDYQYLSRPELLRDKTSDIFLLNRDGDPCSVELPGRRLKIIQEHLPNVSLKAKTLHPHLLRHSIATHLLHAGMSLENVSQMLGHSSLDITQRYTHLAAEYATLTPLKP